MKRKPEELVEYLYRNNSFPHGCFLLTGTGVVPPDSFTLKLATRFASPFRRLGRW
jgi:2-dehydro-3-deoxy-D-arabinonate dehydratase